MKRWVMLFAGLTGMTVGRAEGQGQTAIQPPAQAPVSISGPPTAAIPQVDSSAATVVSGQEVEVDGSRLFAI